ncbi:MAG: proprotein convertase P-domain-containing protein [Phycisphaerae bacterium]|nr:proprotein convertase P-domain-containing protein [Phycisphaerae bacterium]
MRPVLSLLVVAALSHAAAAESAWRSQPPAPDAGLAAAPAAALSVAHKQAFRYRLFRTDFASLRVRVEAAARNGSDPNAILAPLDLPMPDGSLQRFRIFEVPVMAPELAAEYPTFKAFAGESLETPGATVRLSLTARGFHGMILSPEGDVFINPADELPTDRTEYYLSFYKEDAADQGAALDCRVIDAEGNDESPTLSVGASTVARGSTLNTLTLGFLPTAEWSILHGGTVELALSALIEHTSRISAIYERDVCIRFILPAQQDKLIQLNPETDQLTNSSTDALFGQGGNFQRLVPNLQTNVRIIIGTYGGGVARLRSVCTNSASVANSGLAVDYVYTTMVACHELGHQFGANHTFSGEGERCGPNFGVGIEPGGGSTIMSYAQQCYPDGIVNQSELMFHAYSIHEMFPDTSRCGTTTATDNTAPSMDLPAGLVLVAPTGTPLRLPVVASDAQGDAMTFAWAQSSPGQQASLANGDTGNNSIIRTFLPTTEAERVIPAWHHLLNNTNSPGETLPTKARTLQMELIGRDNHPGAGGTSWLVAPISIVATPEPFAVLSPNDANARSAGPLLVTWRTAGTQSAPFNLANVRISIMRDDADRNPLVLAASTPNDGSQVVNIPDDFSSSSARILVRPVNAVFFDVSRTPFPVFPRTNPGADVHIASPASNTARISDDFADGNNNGIAEVGESRVRLHIPLLNSGFGSASGVFATLESLTPGVLVVVDRADWNPIAPGAVSENATPFVFAVAPSHPCGTPATFALTVHAGADSFVHAFEVPIGDNAQISTPQVFSYTGPAAHIPDGNTNGVSIPLNIASLPGEVIDIKFRFDGTPSIDMNSTLVGLNHPFDGDLIITLSNPSGTSIELVNRPGGTGNFGHNFAATLFDMQQIKSYIQHEIPRRAPYDGVFWPKDDLNALIDDNAIGTWILNVADVQPGQFTEAAPTVPASVRRFSLLLTCRLPAICNPAAAYCPGDFDHSNSVDDADFILFANAYDELDSSAGDLNGDSRTDDADFLEFAGAYDTLVCPSQSAIAAARFK